MQNKKRSLSLSLIALTLAMAAGLSGQIRTTPASTAPAASSDTPRLASISYDASKAGKDEDKQQPFETGHSDKNDVSRPLREIGLGVVPQWITPREMPEPKGDGGNQAAQRPQVTDPVVQRDFGNGPASALAAPAPGKNFAGLTNRNGVYPPDTNGDVGPNHFVQWVNSSIQMFDKNGATVYGPTNGNTIWAGFGGPCETTNDGDPIVLYDSMADRWLLAQFTASSPYGECVAISTSPDPTGSYYRYFFQFSTTVFYDYPHLGVWPDGYYMGANRFTATFQGPAAVVFDRAKMLQGQAATYQAFNVGSSYGTLLPSDLDGSRLPPTGQANVFASKGANSLQFWKFHVNWTTPSSSSFTGPTTVATAAYNALCPSSRSCVKQPSTSVGLDGLGDRLMHRLAYRNFGDHETLVATHNVNAASSGTQAAVRWYEVRNPNGTPSIYQQGTYAPDATNRWLGSVAQDGQGNMALVYSASSSSVYPGIRYAGRLTTDTLGTLGQTEVTLQAGSGSQTGTGSRWGDYAMMTIDPVDDCTFWMTTEYMPTTGTASWATRIGAFKFPSCGGTPPTPTDTPVPAATNTPVPAATNTPAPGATNTPIPTATNTPVPQATATNTPVASTCNEGLTNGGFESGSSPWVQTSTGGYNLVDTTRPHTGSYSAYLAGYNNATDTIYQQVTIPANATSATLTYWWNMSTQETGATKYDFLYARVLNSSGTTLATLQTMSNADTQNTWKQSSFNLLAYKGQTVRVYFKGTTDSSLTTSFFVDDVSLNICH